MATLEFDEAATRRLLAVYTTPDVVAQREVVVAALAPRPGERIVDVGSGPGFLLASLADAVGPEGAVCGVEISEPLSALARAHCASRPWVEVRSGDAVELPLDDASFDAAVSTQVLEYVEDVDAAIRELFRVLRPGGRVALLDTDWDSIVWHARDRERADRVLSAWNRHAPHPHLPRTLGARLIAAGFEVRSTSVIPLFNPRYHAQTYSNAMIDLIASYVTAHAGIDADESRAWAADLRELGEGGEYFFSLNRYLFEAVKPAKRAQA